MNAPADTLELRARASGPRFHLAGRPVHGGDTLQLCFSGGWVTGRYEGVVSRGAAVRGVARCGVAVVDDDAPAPDEHADANTRRSTAAERRNDRG